MLNRAAQKFLSESSYSSLVKYREEQKLYTATEADWWLVKLILPSVFWRALTRYRKTISQGLQDYWVINKVFSKKQGGFFVDIGAADGITINNTYLLEKRYRWKGICVEPNPAYFRKLKTARDCIALNVCVSDKSENIAFKCDGLFGRIEDGKSVSDGLTKMQSMSLVDILHQCNAPKVIDYLSIDVEGYEDRVLCDFPFDKYTFLAITIERPSDRLNNILLNNGYRLAFKVYCQDGGEDLWLDNFYLHQSYPGVNRSGEVFHCQNLGKALPYFENTKEEPTA